MKAWLWLRLPWIAAACFCIGMWALLSSDPRLKREVWPDYSVRKTTNEGLSLAYTYLQRRLAGTSRVEPLALPLERADLDPAAVVFRIHPDRAPITESKQEAEEFEVETHRLSKSRLLLHPGEEAWIRAGGQLVLAIDEDYGPLRVVSLPTDAPITKVYPVWPGVEQITYSSRLTLEGTDLGKMETLLLRGDQPVAARLRLGKGHLIVLSFPAAFSNAHLGDGDHLELLEQLARSAPKVYFDEFVHNVGKDAGIIEALRRWGFGPFILILAVGGFFYVWRQRLRLGPPEDPHRETRNVTLDLVEALGPLYNEALRRHQALALYYKALVQTVATQTGLRGKALSHRVLELTQSQPAPVHTDRRDIDHVAFLRQMKTLNEAFRRLENAKRS